MQKLGAYSRASQECGGAASVIVGLEMSKAKELVKKKTNGEKA